MIHNKIRILNYNEEEIPIEEIYDWTYDHKETKEANNRIARKETETINKVILNYEQTTTI